MKKITLHSEVSYLLGILFLGIGTAMVTKADLGVSMVVAPAYILHLKISEIFPYYSFGISEYVVQAFLLIVMMILLRKFRFTYLISFVTALAYGGILDGTLIVMGGWTMNALWAQILFFAAGFLITAFGVAFFFRTYVSPAVYELFVKEVSSHFHLPINRFKTVFDCTFCVIAIILSFVFFGFGHFEGIKWATVVCALLNGLTIGLIGKLLDKITVVSDLLPYRKYFTGTVIPSELKETDNKQSEEELSKPGKEEKNDN